MKTHRKKRLYIVISILAGLSAAALILGFALSKNLNHYYSISDVHGGLAPLNQTVRIGGMVKTGTIERAQDLDFTFVVTDFDQDIVVKYSGNLPDLFREGQGVMAKGKLVSKDVFEAQEILAKHDENYIPKEMKEDLEKSHMHLNQS